MFLMTSYTNHQYPCDVDRVTALIVEVTQTGRAFSCTRKVFKLCKTFSKFNCVIHKKNGKSELFGGVAQNC